MRERQGQTPEFLIDLSVAIPALPFGRDVGTHQQTGSVPQGVTEVTEYVISIDRRYAGLRQRAFNGTHMGMVLELTGQEGQLTQAYTMLEWG
jgi:hypothetical protein